MFYLDSTFDFNFLFVDVEYNFVNTKKQQAQYVGRAFKTIPELIASWKFIKVFKKFFTGAFLFENIIQLLLFCGEFLGG